MRGGKGNDDTHESGAAVLGCGDGGGAFVASSPSFASGVESLGGTSSSDTERSEQRPIRCD